MPHPVTAKERKAAERAFARGVKLRAAGKEQEAYELFDRAAGLDPSRPEYLTTREVARQQMVYDHLQRGNAEMLAGKQTRSEEHTSELQSHVQLVCRLLIEKKKQSSHVILIT